MDILTAVRICKTLISLLFGLRRIRTMLYFYIQFAIHTGFGYLDFQIPSVPKKITFKTGQKLLIQGIFR